MVMSGRVRGGEKEGNKETEKDGKGGGGEREEEEKIVENL